MNKVVHFEVPFDDGERAKKFYTDVFDWKFNDMPEMNYIIAHTCETDENMMPTQKGCINGGMYARTDGGAKGPVLVLEVDDCEAYVKKVEDHGGKMILPARRVGDMGIYSQVQDSEGNIIGLWQPLKKE